MTYNPNRALFRLFVSLALLSILIVYGWVIYPIEVPMDLMARRQPPSPAYWFGTDSLGRDLWLRCFQWAADKTSLQIGLIAAFASGLLAMLTASLCAINKTLDYIIRGLIDSMRHCLTCCCWCDLFHVKVETRRYSGGSTHPLAKARIDSTRRNLRIRETDYVMLSHRLGNSNFYRWRHHLLLLLLPQWIVGTLLMFPHAVAQQRSVFLGLGCHP